MALEKVDDLTDRLHDIIARGGVGVGAAMGAGRAALAGKNPAWGAIKGAVSGLSTPGKVGLVFAPVLAPVLWLVLLMVLVVALMIVAIVKAARS